MRWLLVAVLVLQAPLLFIILISAGADGRRGSVAEVYAFALPVIACNVLVLYRLILRHEWRWFDWALAVVACAPTLWAVFGVLGTSQTRR